MPNYEVFSYLNCAVFRFKSNEIDGHMILEMSKLHKRSPEKVLDLLKESLGLNPLISLKVASIIDKLTFA